MNIIVTIEYTPAKWFDDSWFTDEGIKQKFEDTSFGVQIAKVVRIERVKE